MGKIFFSFSDQYLYLIANTWCTSQKKKRKILDMENWRKDLKEGMTTGSVNDPSEIFVKLEFGTITDSNPEVVLCFGDLIPPDSTVKINALLLVTIVVPEDQRRQGHCRNILEFLEKRATDKGLRFAVGPFFEDEDGNSILADYLLKKRNYRSVMPFCALFQSDDNK